MPVFFPSSLFFFESVFVFNSRLQSWKWKWKIDNVSGSAVSIFTFIKLSIMTLTVLVEANNICLCLIASIFSTGHFFKEDADCDRRASPPSTPTPLWLYMCASHGKEGLSFHCVNLEQRKEKWENKHEAQLIYNTLSSTKTATSASPVPLTPATPSSQTSTFPTTAITNSPSVLWH